jgi:predicted nucleic acid-binding protein
MADVDLEACVQLAHEQSIYAYDAYFLDCARRYRTPLLSLDDPQRRRPVQRGNDVMEVAG